MGAVFRKHPTQAQPVPSLSVRTHHPAPGFDPRGLAVDCLLWCRADAGVNENGSTVSGWEDMSGNGNDLAQATASAQPALEVGGLGGRPELTFDGSNDVLTGPSLFGMLSANDEWTIALIVRDWTWGTAINATWGTAFARGAMSAPSGGGAYFGLVAGDSSNGLCSGYYDGATPSEVAFPPAAGSQGAASVWVTVCDGTDLTCRINGAAGTANTGGGGLVSNATTLGLGTGSSSGDFWDGGISEVLIFDGVLSAQDLGMLEDYLIDRYEVSP